MHGTVVSPIAGNYILCNRVFIYAGIRVYTGMVQVSTYIFGVILRASRSDKPAYNC